MVADRKLRSKRWPSPALAEVASQLEFLGEAASHLLAIWTVLAGLVLAWMHLAIGDYLEAFGLLGSSAFGETAGFLAAILPTIIRVLLVLTGLALFPLLGGIVSGTSRHAFRGAFGWLERTRKGRDLSALRFLMMHLIALLVALALMIAFLFPRAGDRGAVYIIALALGVSATYWWIHFHAKNKRGKALTAFWSSSIAITFYVNFALLLWLVLTARLAIAILADPLAGLSTNQGAWAGCLVVVVLLCVYMLISILPRQTSMIFLAVIATLAVISSDNRPIAGGFLRVARLGGGIPQTYYPQDQKAHAEPRRVCLILAIGEARIVWVPDSQTAKTASPCASPAFKAHFQPKSGQQAQDPFKSASDTLILKREDFTGSTSITQRALP